MRERLRVSSDPYAGVEWEPHAKRAAGLYPRRCNGSRFLDRVREPCPRHQPRGIHGKCTAEEDIRRTRGVGC